MSEAESVKDVSELKVLGVFAHPDDAEFFAGGTFAKWAADGADITFVIATRGDKGSAELDMTSEKLAAIREAEAKKAGEVLGIEVVFLNYIDGELYPNLELRKDITRMIRLKKPDIVVTLDPTVFWYGTRGINHPDHRAIGAATLEAVFPLARDRLNFPEMETEEGLETHNALTVYIAGAADPTTEIDVTGHIEKQVEALYEHKSQIKEPEKLLDRLKERSRDPEAPAQYPRHVERFRVIQLRG